MGALRQNPPFLPSVRAGQHGRRGAPAVRRQPYPGRRNLELPHHRRSAAFRARAPQPRDVGRGPSPSRTADGKGRRKTEAEKGGGARQAQLAQQVRAFGENHEIKEARAGREAQVAPVAFLRFSRDKRGYEQFAIVEPMTNRRGATRPRVLYAFRTPPDIKVGREPFDEEARCALEARYPGIKFDWRKIVETPIPSADAERWRERRRADKAARQVAAAEVAAEGADHAAGPELPEPPQASAKGSEPSTTNPADAIPDAGAVAPLSEAGANRRRRRRRRGRGGASAAQPGAPPTSAEAEPSGDFHATNDAPESAED